MPDEREQNSQEQPTVPQSQPEYTEPPHPSPLASDDDVPFKLPLVNTDPAEHTVDYRAAATPPQPQPVPPYQQLTAPVFREPGVTDPRVTLPGSGGLDPNPDMPTFRQENTQTNPQIQPTLTNPVIQPTVPHEVQPPAALPTVLHQPAVSSPPANPLQAGYTMQNPNVAETQPYPRVGVQPAQGQYVPAPPPVPSQKRLPTRRQRSRILGLNAGCVWVVLGLVVTFCGGFTLLTGTIAAIFIPRIEDQWQRQIDRVDDYQSFQSTFLYDRYGNTLYEVFGEGRRVIVPYDRFPKFLIDATVAIEDDSFWDNVGVDIPATTVAVLQFLGAGAGERTAGGSTITQQVVRNILFDYEKRNEISASRKAEEIILAMFLTQRKPKQEILAMYLNEIYYGNLAYGAQTAAQILFGKNVENLTLGEAALLAGLPQSPSSLDPLNPDPEVQAAVYARQRQVLDEMVEEKYITKAQRDQAISEGLSFITPEVALNAPHFTIYAQNEMEDLLTELGYSPEDITRGGLRVYTTVDQTVNSLALSAAQAQVATLTRQNVSNASVVVLKPVTGEILAMVGSIDYNSTVIDGRVNVAIALRQPGSTMKLFTYAAALERGMTAGDVLWDTRTDIGIPGQPMYTPRNYDGAFHGPMTMRRALANSYNIPAVQTLRIVGVDYLLQFLRRLGIETLGTDAGQYGLSLTLGGGEISLIELTNAYGVFANQGAYVRPTSILCILNSDDEIIYQYENGCGGKGRVTDKTVNRTGFGKQVVDPRIAYLLANILGDNTARTPAMGANSPLRTDGIISSVKTGTTNDYKDNWTVGFTRNVVIGVWVGNNDGTPMTNVSGLTGAAPIWNAVIRAIYATPEALNSLAVNGALLSDDIQPSAGMSLRQICDVRRIVDPSSDCAGRVNEWFLDGPAGIPDENGNLQFPPDQPLPQPQGDFVEMYSPGIYRALVYPIPDYIATGITFQLNAGDKQPPPPKYCRVRADQAEIAVGAQDLIFIAGPTTSQGDAVEAENYARSNTLAILPTIDCWNEVFTAVPTQSYGPGITTAVISSPTNGAIVTNDMPIMGTAQFDSSIAEFYHLEIQGGPFPNWTPLGNPGYSSVIDGQLEYLSASVLPAGNYRLRLVLVKGGNIIQQPYEIFFTKQ